MACNLQASVNSAKCFECLSEAEIDAIIVYLLCLWANK